MGLFKISLLLCLLFAAREVQSILWNKHLAHISNLGLKAAQTLIPIKPLELETGSQTVRKGLESASVESDLKDSLPKYEFSIPHSEEWASKTTHETKKLTPEGEIIHRDNRIVVKWTGDCDEDIIDTPYKFVGVLNDVDDINALHQMIHSHKYDPNHVNNGTQETSTGEISSSSISESVDVRHLDSSENTTKLEQEQRSENSEKNEDVTSMPSEVESNVLVDYDNHTEVTSDAALQEESPDIVGDKENYKADFAAISERNINIKPLYINSQTNASKSVDRSINTSAEVSGDTEKTSDVTFRSSALDGYSEPPGPMQRIPSKDYKELPLRKSLWMIKIRNQNRPNATALSNNKIYRANITTLNKIIATPEESLQKNDIRPEVGPYTNYRASVDPQLLGSKRFDDSVPYGGQVLNGFPVSKPFNQRQYDTVYRYGYGPTTGASPRLVFPNLQQGQDLLSSYVPKPPQGLYRYNQNIPSFDDTMNPSAIDQNFLASIYRYMQSPYADEFAFKLSQSGGLPDMPSKPAVTPTYDIIPGGNRWLWRP